MARKTFRQRFQETRSRFQDAIDAFLKGDDPIIDLYGAMSKSGEYVTERTALKSTAYAAALRVLADTIASLPIHTYRRLDKGKEKAYKNPIYGLLHNKPNPYMTPFTFKQTLQYHILLWGNGYAEIESDGRGNIKNLWPMMPDRVEHKKNQKGEPFFEIRLQDGTTKALADYQVLHIPGLGFDGTKGYSPLYMAREAIGLSIALQDFGSTFFLNGANIGGVLEHPGKLGDVARDNLKKSIKEQYEGLSNAHRLMLLEEGMKYTKTVMPLNDAQFIEARKFQDIEMARIIGVPPHLIYDLEHATFSNIEHQGIEFVVYSLRPWLIRWEQTLNWKLLYNDPNYFTEFLVDALLRGDTKTRYEAYAIARMWGWLSANDVRELENMNPVNGGDIYLSPLNMINAADLNTAIDKTLRMKPNPSIPEETTQESLLSAYKEERDKRISKLGEVYRGLFVDVSIRIIKREKIYVMREAKKAFKKNDKKQFNEFLDKFYSEHIEYVSKQLRPIVSSYSQALSELIKEQINFEGDINSNLDVFNEKYSTGEATEYSAGQKEEIKNIVTKIIKDKADVVKILNAEFDKWEENKPDEFSNKETIKISDLVADLIYKLAGVKIT